MKERIVVERPINNINDDDYIHIYHFARKEYLKYKIEKLPEIFSELKELCKDLKDVDIEEADDLDVARIIIHNADLIYFEDEILMIAGFKKLEIKPEKMWNIIKSLIGEE